VPRACPTPRSSSWRWPAPRRRSREPTLPAELAAALFGAFGLGLGLAADRLATRWPEHDEEEHPPGRRVDWRTITIGAIGAAAFALLPGRLGADPLALTIFGAWFCLLIVGLATDLDQRLLPNETTLPVIPVAAVYALSGANPFVGTEIVPAIIAAAAIPAVLYLPSLPFGAEAFGLGDVKLLVGAGLMLGGLRAVGGVAFGLLVAGIVLVVLLIARRIGRRSYVPFGPFLILGILWGVLIRP
jgi:leader peptidase (prepilin peptidase) / N-methyltransferase